MKWELSFFRIDAILSISSPCRDSSKSVDCVKLNSEIGGNCSSLGSDSQARKTSKPYVGMKFNSHLEGYNFYNA